MTATKSSSKATLGKRSPSSGHRGGKGNLAKSHSSAGGKATPVKSLSKMTAKHSSPGGRSGVGCRDVKTTAAEHSPSGAGSKAIPAKLPFKTTGKHSSPGTKSGGRPCGIHSTARKKGRLPLGHGMRPLLRTFPGDLARQIIVGMDCPRSDDPPKPRSSQHSEPCSGGVRDLDAGDSLPNSIGPVKMSRNIRKRMRRQQRNLARLTGDVLPLRDHPSRYRVTHSAVGNLISKCLPQHCVPQFLKSFQSSIDDYIRDTKCDGATENDISAKTPPDPARTVVATVDDDMVVKTPVRIITSALHDVFGKDYVSVVACTSPAAVFESHYLVSYADLEFVLLDCILARKRSSHKAHKLKRKCSRKIVDTPVKMLSCKRPTGSGDADFDEDECYRACIVILPDAGLYYCHRERRQESAGKVGTHVPMDINWLRLRNQGVGSFLDWFGKGSYVLRMSGESRPKAFKFSIRRSECNFLPTQHRIKHLEDKTLPHQVFRCYQCPDEDGPCLPPDFINGKDSELSMKARRILYRRRYQQTPSAKRGCRHYVRSMLYKRIDPKVTWIIDPADGSPEVDLHITVLIGPHGRMTGKAGLHRVSVLKIRYLPQVVGDEQSTTLLKDIHEHCIQVKNGKRGGARGGKGDNGHMYPIGNHADGLEMKRYAASSHESHIPKLRKAVTAAYKLASVTVPAVVRVIQDIEDDAGVPRLAGMDGEKGRVTRVDGKSVLHRFCLLGHTMDLSVNLENASHFDVNDASQGFSVWTEDYPGGNKTWYFVLPNLRGKFPDSDREYQGVAIKLSHGVLISWDGRVVRHCTSVRDEPNGDVCGTFFAAKTRVVRQGMRRAHERVRAMGLAVEELERKKDMENDVAVCGNESVDASDSPPVVPVDGDGDLSVSSALEISEDEDEDADDDDSSDGGISISSETKCLMGNDPFEGVCLYEPESKFMDLPLEAIIGKEKMMVHLVNN